MDLRSRLAASLLAAAAGCVTGTGAGIAAGDGRVTAHAPPASWKRIAVLPLAGPPQVPRPCEEVLALRLAEQTVFDVVPPFAVRRAARRARAAVDGAEPDWSALVLDSPGRPAFTPAEARRLARALGVDAIVVGAVVRGGPDLPGPAPSGSVPVRGGLDLPGPAPAGGVPADGLDLSPFDVPGVDLALVDGATGDTVALERWRESVGWTWSRRDPALHATACAAADLLAVLQTPPGEKPRRPAPDQDCAAPAPSPGPQVT
ncbi:MAG TPA: hypothetical protein VML50_17695 [Anaeromyxobacter sp.]|nr:hypothetical protein [Anaeromyxobacter sp.]